MSRLKQIRAANMAQFSKVKDYLDQNKTDFKKVSSNNLPPLQFNQALSSVPQNSKEEEQDNYEINFLEYLQLKQNQPQELKQNCQQETTERGKQHIGNIQDTPQQPNSQWPLELTDYQYQAPESTGIEIEFQFKPFEEVPKKRGKFKQPKKLNLDLISPLEQKGKVTIEDLLIKEEPISINYIKADNQAWQNYKKNEDFKLEYVLSKLPNIKNFKNNQKAIIKCGLEHNNIFVCMPTGGGKSLTFQILTFLDRGVYICVLPLVSLIFDQEQQAKRMGIQAYSLTGNTKAGEAKQIFKKALDFEQSERSIVIFCTPEKINMNQSFTEVVEALYSKGKIKRFIIDEVHCVSTWGKDFRIEYEKLSSLKKKYPKVPILGLTATVTEVVKQDIISRLGIQGCYFFQSSFNRPNLYYEVRQKKKSIVQDIESIIRKYKHQSGIIYCLAKRECEELSSTLNQRGHLTAYYHADINEQDKKYIQEQWMNNQIQVILATVAFGMGINKPDVRFVIHHSLSKSLENYYQESGRAGRDGQFSECILFYRKSDQQFLQRMNLQNDFSSLERKQFSSKQLAQMIKYCQDPSTCRRQFQLHYLGETDFDPKLCNKTCDNCKKGQIFLSYQCISLAKALVRLLIYAQKLNLSLSKKQLIDTILNRSEKTARYKLEKLSRSGVDLASLRSLFKGWRANQIQNMILDLMSYDILNQKIVKNQIVKKNKESQAINVYLKCNLIRSNIFLDQVETFPFKLQVNSNQTLTWDETEETYQQQIQFQVEREGKQEDQKERAEKYEKYRQLLEDIEEDGEEST